MASNQFGLLNNHNYHQNQRSNGHLNVSRSRELLQNGAFVNRAMSDDEDDDEEEDDDEDDAEVMSEVQSHRMNKAASHVSLTSRHSRGAYLQVKHPSTVGSV